MFTTKNVYTCKHLNDAQKSMHLYTKSHSGGRSLRLWAGVRGCGRAQRCSMASFALTPALPIAHAFPFVLARSQVLEVCPELRQPLSRFRNSPFRQLQFLSLRLLASNRLLWPIGLSAFGEDLKRIKHSIDLTATPCLCRCRRALTRQPRLRQGRLV